MYIYNYVNNADAIYVNNGLKNVNKLYYGSNPFSAVGRMYVCM